MTRAVQNQQRIQIWALIKSCPMRVRPMLRNNLQKIWTRSNSCSITKKMMMSGRQTAMTRVSVSKPTFSTSTSILWIFFCRSYKTLISNPMLSVWMTLSNHTQTSNNSKSRTTWSTRPLPKAKFSAAPFSRSCPANENCEGSWAGSIDPVIKSICQTSSSSSRKQLSTTFNSNSLLYRGTSSYN